MRKYLKWLVLFLGFSATAWAQTPAPQAGFSSEYPNWGPGAGYTADRSLSNLAPDAANHVTVNNYSSTCTSALLNCPMFLGYQAGASFTAGSGADALFPLALANLNGNLLEDTAIGASAGYAATTAGELTAVGWAACFSLQTDSYASCFGTDAGRNMMGTYAATALGTQAFRSGTGSYVTAVGTFAYNGNSGSVIFGGTVAATDVVCLNFTSSAAGVTGVPASACVTLGGGDTLSTLATKMTTAINALTPAMAGTAPNGTSYTAFAHQLTAAQVSGTFTGNAASLEWNFNGTSTVGFAISATLSCTVGPCGETAAIGGGASGSDNTAVGAGAMYGSAMSTTHDTDALGFVSLASLTTGYDNDAVGSQSLFNAQAEYDNVAFGVKAGYALNNPGSAAHDNVLLGAFSGQGMTTGSDNIILGAEPSAVATGGCITTGSVNIEIGYGACVVSPTASGQLSIGNLITARALSSNALASIGEVGIGSTTYGGTLNIGEVSGSYGGGHLGFYSLTPPTLSTCGTGPTADANATDVAGTITPGSGATACTITFATTYQTTAPHCVVSGNASGVAPYIGTGPSLTAFTVNWTTAGKFTYMCMQ